MLELPVLDEDAQVILQFEHSLYSVSKWESRTKLPWSIAGQKTSSEMVAYYQDMMISDHDPNLVYGLSPEQQDELTIYINTPQTASSVPKTGPQRRNTETITSELIYYWLSALKLNWEAQHWHLSRCMMLIEIAGYKQAPAKKRNPREVLTDWAQQNEERKKKFGISG